MKNNNTNNNNPKNSAAAAASTGKDSNMQRRLLHIIFYLGISILPFASANWIDPETPEIYRTTTSLVDGSIYQLVMSDEFNVPNRTFKDGHDKMWTALDKSDDDASSAGGGALHFYNSSQATTKDGYLHLHTTLGETKWNHFDHVNQSWTHEVKHFKSAMMQSWNKFCFTGGIVEIDVILPGDPHIGGLWPAVWMLGNLGRATYEASTNNIWPWSYDKCDRTKQSQQLISACNNVNHYGLHKNQGRGATEIDILEVMTGESKGPLPGPKPQISFPYADMTLQVAPGIETNRPSCCKLPVRPGTWDYKHKYVLNPQTWYDTGIEIAGNTSINPFFYGTYLAETKPNEPVTRTEHQAFQADALGVVHQLTPRHFKQKHTFRLEWQPGPGGRIDWYTKSHKINDKLHMEGDGKGTDWVHTLAIKDEALASMLGAQIPVEPTSLIMNTAISSTWGFPDVLPDHCEPCYDCNNPKCECAFQSGFCRMIRKGNVKMSIDHIRLYQSNDDSAHGGNKHTLGCDPPEYPTHGWIEGHQYMFMRNPPFSYDDKRPLRKIQRGGGLCNTNSDCGGVDDIDEGDKNNNESTTTGQPKTVKMDSLNIPGKGRCVNGNDFRPYILAKKIHDRVCECSSGFTGPQCLAINHIDESESARANWLNHSPFIKVESLRLTPGMVGLFLFMAAFFLISLIVTVISRKKSNRGVRSSSLEAVPFM